MVAPNLPTCYRRVIDFFVVSQELAGAVMGVRPIGDALCKAHRPVRLYIKAKPRMMAVRNLKAMGTFAAEQPYGPAVKVEYKPEVEVGLNVHQKYRLFVDRMEKELTSLAPLDDKGFKAVTGRNEGPRFVMRCAIGEEEVGPRRTTAVSRAWRKTAGWLEDIQRSDKVVVREAAKRKLLTYPHPPPAYLKATPEQHKSFDVFVVWHEITTQEVLQHASWVKVLKMAAMKNADKEEKAA